MGTTEDIEHTEVAPVFRVFSVFRGSNNLKFAVHQMEKSMTGLLFENETFKIRGACFEVYKEKGAGFLESAYQECVEIEFALQEIPFVSQPPLTLIYKGRQLKTKYAPDLICFDKIVVEQKAVTQLANEHRAQVHNYLKATDLRLGLLVNFGHYPKVEIERIIR